MRTYFVCAALAGALAFACSSGPSGGADAKSANAPSATGDVCADLCARLAGCDRRRDELTCRASCKDDLAAIVPRLRSEVVESVDACVVAQDCKTVLEGSPASRCIDAAKAKVAPDDAAKAYCEKLVAAEHTCGAEPDEATCLDGVKVFGDEAIRAAASCLDGACERMDDCISAALGGNSSPASDTGRHDAGFSDAAPRDGSVADAGHDADAALVGCVPHPIGAFTPSYHPPAPIHAGRCTAQQIEEFGTVCLGEGDTSTCSNFISAHGDCARCIDSRETDSVYGAIIDYNGFVNTNEPGCVAATDRSPAGQACARALQALEQCHVAACQAACPITGADSIEALDACMETANGGVCKVYADGAESACGAEDAGPAAACLAISDFATGYTTLATLFCGP